MAKRRKRTRIPSLRHHKSSGLAVVRLCGKDIYLGAFGSTEATEAYNRTVGEWLSNGRTLPNESTKPTPKGIGVAGGDRLTIAALLSSIESGLRLGIKTRIKPVYFGTLPSR